MKTEQQNAAQLGRCLPAPGRKRRRQKDLREVKVCGLNRPVDEDYRRLRDLPRLVALWPRELLDHSIKGKLRIIAKLRQAIRAERRRGSAGHWSYDLERHLFLSRALKAEIASLENMEKPPAA